MSGTIQRRLLGGVVAALMGSGASAQDFDLRGERFEIGERALVEIDGVAGTDFSLLFDTAPGDWNLPGGAWLGLGFSKDFAFVYFGEVPDGNPLQLEFDLADDPSLVGMEFFLQCAGTRPGESVWITTPRLDLAVGNGESGTILGAVPGPSTPIEGDTVFEVWVDRGLSDVTVDESSVRIRRDDTGELLPAAVRLVEYHAAATVVVHPRQPLPRGVPLTLELSGSVRDDGGNSLAGPHRFSFQVARRQHPLLLTTVDQVELFKDRVQRNVQPWSGSYDRMRQEADGDAMRHSPDPHHGPPPTGWSEYVDVYVRWFTSARYAQDLALASLVSGDTRYADKAREILRAWLVYEPDVVGKWYWVIQTDIAGLCMVDALDLLWSYEGLSNQDREDFRGFLTGLADAVRTWQLDDKDDDPENIRSWTNTLIMALGTFLERQDLVDFAIERDGGNPFPFLDMFERAMDSDGRMYDAYRGNQEPFWEVTYPVYHLQAWALLSEISMNRGRNLFHLRDADGHTQEQGWSYYVPYLDGQIKVDGLTEQIIRDFCISKYYPVQRVYGQQDYEDLFGLYGGEPQYETHIRKKSATFSQKAPFAGSDDQPPARPGDLIAVSIGSTVVQLVWAPSPFADESDVAVVYEVRRDGALLRRVGTPHFNDRGLQVGGSYHYEVRPVDAAGNLGPSVNQVVTTVAPEGD